MINMILEVASALPVDREDGGTGVGSFQFHLFFTVGFFFRDILGVLNGAFLFTSLTAFARDFRDSVRELRLELMLIVR